METLTKEVLKAKSFEYVSGWNGDRKSIATGGRGNIQILTDSIVSFQEHNMLPANGSQLDGHYTIYVNYKTFDYVLHRHGYYGSLTYYHNRNDEFLSSMSDTTKSIVESIISHRLLGAYYYSSKDINHRGENLIQGSRPKTSLLCDYRGYLWSGLKPETKSERDIEACNLIDENFTRPGVVVMDVDFSNRTVVRNNRCAYELNYVHTTFFVPFTANNIKYTLVKCSGKFHLEDDIYVVTESGEKFGSVTHRCLKDYINILPNLILSKYH